MIYNASSIYNQGGGGSGGGYKDGGELVDADFIKVENNTVSTYENTSRNDVNFYIEVSDGDIINCVVELETEVNATIHVYKLSNGLYIPLGNIGGDSVTANNDYNINIIGNSFAIEQVSGNNGNAEYANINNVITPLFYFGNRIWTGVIGLSTRLPDSYKVGDWRLPTDADITALSSIYDTYEKVKALRSTSGWNNTQGTNTTGFNAKPDGYYAYNQYSQTYSWQYVGTYALYLKNASGGNQLMMITESFVGSLSGGLAWNKDKAYYRLCKDA